MDRAQCLKSRTQALTNLLSASGRPIFLGECVMVGMVIIEDKHNRFLTFDLADILPLLSPKAQRLRWAILELEALGTLPDARYRQGIEQSPNGLLLTWDELRAVATAFR